MRHKNPYIGPRSFRETEGAFFFGRNGDARELRARIVSNRVTLFYAQTGAGKTSLLNARLRPDLRKKGFILLPNARVKGAIEINRHSSAKIDNIFMLHLMTSIAPPKRGTTATAEELYGQLTLSDFLADLVTDDGVHFSYEKSDHIEEEEPTPDESQGTPYLLAIDQFEELFLHHLEQWEQRRDFFEQLNEALKRDSSLWILLTMREDYIAWLDPYLPLLSGRLQNRYYMQRLEHNSAMEAVVEPAKKAGRPFDNGVAKALVEDLRRLQYRDHNESFLGQYVEPIILQVTCVQLWDIAEKNGSSTIQHKHLGKLGDVTQVLKTFYEQILQDVTKSPHFKRYDELNEGLLRNWFGERLITKQNTRGSLFREPQYTAGLPDTVIEILLEKSIVRVVGRMGGNWIELSHDRFIEPILDANQDYKKGLELHYLLQSQQRRQQRGLTRSTNNLPVVLAAFGQEAQKQSDRGAARAALIRTLRNAQNLCHTIVDNEASPSKAIELWANFDHQVSIFHFDGTALEYENFFGNKILNPKTSKPIDMVEYLGEQYNLKLVCLSRCPSITYVQQLLNAGVSAVIATMAYILEEVEVDFNLYLYKGLVGGSTIEWSFRQSIDTIIASRSSSPAALSQKELAGGDRYPWLMLLRPGAETTKDWNLPQAAGDPLFGLPTPPPRPLPEKPFFHLYRFKEEHAELFFGRGYQIRRLYGLVARTAAAPVICLHGQTGVGKSSLLSAGLLPRLTETCDTVYLRREPGKQLLGTLCSAFPEAPTSGKGIFKAWKAYEHEHRPLLIIIDQVEEAFTQSHHPEQELQTFFDALRELFHKETERPVGKLLLSFRKEWMAEVLQQLKKRNIPYNEMFLAHLDKRGIIEAIEGPSRSARLVQKYGLSVEPGLATIIADDLLQDESAAIAPTLQILLTKMWEEAQKKASSDGIAFSIENYQKLRRHGILLDDFLAQQLNALSEWPSPEQNVLTSGLALDLLAFYTTPLGTSKQRTRSQLLETYQEHTNIEDLLQQLTSLYLLVEADSDDESSKTTRLSHDTLAPLVRKRFEQSGYPGQRALRLLTLRTPEWQKNPSNTYFDATDLAIVEAGKPGMRSWTEEETQLVEASRKQQHIAEEARQKLEQERENALKEKEIAIAKEKAAVREKEAAVLEKERSTKKQQKRLFASLLLLISLITGAVLGYWQLKNRLDSSQKNLRKKQIEYIVAFAKNQDTLKISSEQHKKTIIAICIRLLKEKKTSRYNKEVVLVGLALSIKYGDLSDLTTVKSILSALHQFVSRKHSSAKHKRFASALIIATLVEHLNEQTWPAYMLSLEKKREDQERSVEENTKKLKKIKKNTITDQKQRKVLQAERERSKENITLVKERIKDSQKFFPSFRSRLQQTAKDFDSVLYDRLIIAWSLLAKQRKKRHVKSLQQALSSRRKFRVEEPKQEPKSKKNTLTIDISEYIRAAAVILLPQADASQWLRRLVVLLGDPSTQVRAAVYDKLVSTKHKALPILLQILEKQNPKKVRLAAIKAIQDITTTPPTGNTYSPVIARLIQLYSNKNEDDTIAKLASRSVAQFGKSAIKQLFDALQTASSEQKRKYSAQALAHLLAHTKLTATFQQDITSQIMTLLKAETSGDVIHAYTLALFSVGANAIPTLTSILKRRAFEEKEKEYAQALLLKMLRSNSPTLLPPTLKAIASLAQNTRSKKTIKQLQTTYGNDVRKLADPATSLPFKKDAAKKVRNAATEALKQLKVTPPQTCPRPIKRRSLRADYRNLRQGTNNAYQYIVRWCDQFKQTKNCLPLKRIYKKRWRPTHARHVCRRDILGVMETQRTLFQEYCSLCKKPSIRSLCNQTLITKWASSMNDIISTINRKLGNKSKPLVCRLPKKRASRDIKPEFVYDPTTRKFVLRIKNVGTQTIKAIRIQLRNISTGRITTLSASQQSIFAGQTSPEYQHTAKEPGWYTAELTYKTSLQKTISQKSLGSARVKTRRYRVHFKINSIHIIKATDRWPGNSHTELKLILISRSPKGRIIAVEQFPQPPNQSQVQEPDRYRKFPVMQNISTESLIKSFSFEVNENQKLRLSLLACDYDAGRGDNKHLGTKRCWKIMHNRNYTDLLTHDMTLSLKNKWQPKVTGAVSSRFIIIYFKVTAKEITAQKPLK